MSTTTTAATALLVPRDAAYVASFYGPEQPDVDTSVDEDEFLEHQLTLGYPDPGGARTTLAADGDAEGDRL